MTDVLLDDVPMRPVLSQRGAILRLVFGGGGVMEASHFEAEGLPATACAKFQGGKTHVCRVELICERTASG